MEIGKTLSDHILHVQLASSVFATNWKVTIPDSLHSALSHQYMQCERYFVQSWQQVVIPVAKRYFVPPPPPPLIAICRPYVAQIWVNHQFVNFYQKRSIPKEK